MPLYEYTCQQCRRDFELLIRRDQRPQCPECGSGRLTKLMSVPSAPASAAQKLPVCEAPAPAGGCGLPQCGGGQCAME